MSSRGQNTPVGAGEPNGSAQIAAIPRGKIIR
jgi:hypothetical protein